MKTTIKKYKSVQAMIEDIGSKQFAMDFKKAQEISRQMCDLRQRVIDRAITWASDPGYVQSTGLRKNVKEYVEFRDKHFPERKK